MDDSTETEPGSPSHLDLFYEAGPVELVNTVDNIVHRVERRDFGTPVFSPDGTDLTLIRQMLARTPEERIRALETAIQLLMKGKATKS